MNHPAALLLTIPSELVDVPTGVAPDKVVEGLGVEHHGVIEVGGVDRDVNAEQILEYVYVLEVEGRQLVVQADLLSEVGRVHPAKKNHT